MVTFDVFPTDWLIDSHTGREPVEPSKQLGMAGYEDISFLRNMGSLAIILLLLAALPVSVVIADENKGRRMFTSHLKRD